MGCDIHGYVEKRYEGLSSEWWRRATLHLPRNYAVFGALAGVRDKTQPMPTPPKGIPHDVSHAVRREYTLWVTDDEPPPRGFASRESVERWFDAGISEVWEEDPLTITHPDWHTPSWMTADELKQALPDNAQSTYHGVVAMLKAMGEVRFVFWFDN